MRKSIFDIASENINMLNETKRIIEMFEDESTIYIAAKFEELSILEFVDEYCFGEWSCRNHYINLDDYLNALQYNTLKISAGYETEAFITFIELIYNMWNLSYLKLFNDNPTSSFKWKGNFFHLKSVMDDILAQYNHRTYICDDRKDCVLIIEDKENVTAVAEILPNNLSLDVIKYNHKSLSGNIKVKREILLTLANQLEPERKKLDTIDSKLSRNIFYMLNNLNIRHNNKSKNDKNYKEYVSKMNNKRLESFYDELYQMILLAFLLLDNTKRMKKIDDLKSKIEG